MLFAGLAIAGMAALVHVYIFVLESLRWTHPRTRALFGVRTAEEAEATRPLAFNQGFYNLFLALAVAAGIVAFALDAPVVGATLVFVGAGSMVAAGVVLMTSNPSLLRSALIQLVPPLLAIVLVAIALTG